MSAAHELCSQIRQVLGSADPPDRESLRALISQYNESVDHVNRRLRRASSWLLKGLTGEAIDSLEVPPNALGLAADLDLGTALADLHDRAIQADIGEVKAVDHEIAAELNEAYTKYEAMEPHLRELRRANIAALSISHRMGLLARLGAAEANNGMWLEQRRQFEEARLREIDRELAHAAKAHTREKMEVLYRELKEYRWSITPPKKLIAGVERAVRRLREETAVRRYRELMPQIHESYGAQDASAVDLLLDEWQAVEVDLGVGPERELAEEIGPAMSWRESRLADEARIREGEELLAQLEWTLEQNEPGDEDEQLLHRLDRLQCDVPRRVRERVATRSKSRTLTRSRRRTLLFVAVATVVTIMAGAIGWRSHVVMRQARLNDFAEQVAASLQESPPGLSAVEKLVETAEQESPWILTDPDMIPLLSRYEELLEAEVHERSAYREAFARLEPLAFDASEVWDLLRRAESLASNLEEDDRVAVRAVRDRLSRELHEYVSASIVIHNERRRGILGRAELARNAAEEFDGASYQEAIVSKLPPLIHELEEIREALSDAAWASEKEMRDQAKPMIAAALQTTNAAIESLYSEVVEARRLTDRRREREEMLAQIQRSWADHEKLESYLSEFIAFFPEVREGEPQYAIHFQSVLSKEAQAWKVLSHHQEICNLLAKEPCVGFRQGAEDRLKAIAVLDVLSDDYPGFETIQAYKEYLQAATVSLEASSLPERLAELRGNLDTPMFTRMRQVKVPSTEGDGDQEHTYFTYSEDEPRSERIGDEFRMYQIEQVVENKGQIDPAAQRGDISVLAPRFTTLKSVKARHVVVAERMKEQFDEASDMRHWDSVCLRLAATVADESMDEIVQIQLLEDLLELHLETSWRASGKIADYLHTIQRVVLDDDLTFSDLEWPSARDARVMKGRERARQLITQWAPDLDSELDQLESRFASMRELPRFTCVGLVWLDEQGEQSLELREGTQYYRAIMEGDRLVMRQIGAGEDETPIMGSLVFARVKAKR